MYGTRKILLRKESMDLELPIQFSWLCLAIVLLSVGCSGQPQTKFTPSDTSASAGQTLAFSFDTESAGGLPKGASAFSGTWVVRAESDAPSQPNALCQTGNATFPALVLGETIYSDLNISVRFKPIAGRSDQAAGIIFRIQDKDNYYIIRANALENNVNFYKYASGQRSGIRDGSANVMSGQWQELRVEMTGNRMRGFLNGQMVNEATDDSYQAGKIGLWTKADSVTCFDDIRAISR